MQYSIVDYQSIVDASHSLRFDAEFFRPDYLQVQRSLEEIGSRRLIDFQVNIRHPKEVIDPQLKRGGNLRKVMRKHLWFSEADWTLQRRYLQFYRVRL